MDEQQTRCTFTREYEKGYEQGRKERERIDNFNKEYDEAMERQVNVFEALKQITRFVSIVEDKTLPIMTVEIKLSSDMAEKLKGKVTL